MHNDHVELENGNVVYIFSETIYVYIKYVLDVIMI